MPWSEQLVHLAEIAGVFVGFAALISIRSSATDAYEVTFLRWIVTYGLVVVATALAPVVITNFGLSGRNVWLACTVLFLVLVAGTSLILNLTPENRSLVAVTSTREIVQQVSAFAVLLLLWLAALLCIVFGLLPGHEAALYVAAEVLFLLETGITLAVLVLAQFRPRAREGRPPRRHEIRGSSL